MVQGAECSVAGHVSWRRSPHVTVMSAQPAGCAVYLPPGSPGPDALLNRSQYSMQYSIHRTLYRRNLAHPLPAIQISILHTGRLAAAGLTRTRRL